MAVSHMGLWLLSVVLAAGAILITLCALVLPGPWQPGQLIIGASAMVAATVLGNRAERRLGEKIKRLFTSAKPQSKD